MTAPAITTIDATTTVTTTVVVTKDDVVATTDVVAEEVTVAAAADDEAAVVVEEQEETPEQREQRILTHQLLARQLEYYFSTANMSRDTYLSTLRDLNDSYVPVSIIANFGKVQALAPYESALEAVVSAATDHSDLLEIVELNDQGKKIVNAGHDDTEEETNTSNTTIILAVGSVSGNPIPMSQIPQQQDNKTKATNETSTSTSTSTSSSPPRSPTSNPKLTASTGSNGISSSPSNVQNTIILREVAEDVVEKILRDLFDFEDCPSIQSIHEDLHNCWFVTLDTSSKDEMFNVMMKLRVKKFPSGDSVKARLKSSASAASISPLNPNSVIYNPKISTMYAPQFHSNSGVANGSNPSNSNINNGGNNHTRKKRSSNNKGRNITNSSSSNSNGNVGTNGSGNGDGNVNISYNNKMKTNQQNSANGGAHTSVKRRNGKDESSSRPSASHNNSNNAAKNNNNNKVTISSAEMLQPPSMGETNFPSLPPTTDGNSKPFQMEKVPTDDEMMRSGKIERQMASGFSDSSSTATTSTASTPTEAPPGGGVAGGYAAALLRPAAPVPVATTTKKAEQQQQEKPKQQQSSAAKKGKDNAKKNQKQNKEEKVVVVQKTESSSDRPAVSVQPPTWGQGRSFADIVSA